MTVSVRAQFSDSFLFTFARFTAGYFCYTPDRAARM